MVMLEPLPGNDILPVNLKKIRDHAANMTPAMLAIMKSLHAVEAQRFANEGPGWEALKQSTIDHRTSHGFGAGPILERTGVLKDSFTGYGDSTDMATAGYMEVISHVEYAHFHQNGEGKNPQRKIIDLTPNTLLLWREILQVYLMTGAVGSASEDAIAMAL